MCHVETMKDKVYAVRRLSHDARRVGFFFKCWEYPSTEKPTDVLFDYIDYLESDNQEKQIVLVRRNKEISGLKESVSIKNDMIEKRDTEIKSLRELVDSGAKVEREKNEEIEKLKTRLKRLSEDKEKLMRHVNEVNERRENGIKTYKKYIEEKEILFANLSGG